MKIGFIGLGNMAGTICQGLIKSDFIDGSEVYGYDINSQQLMMFEQDFGIHVCSSEQDVVKNCDYLGQTKCRRKCYFKNKISH